MEDYRTEEEQIEALKRWWTENGKSIVIGIALAGAAVFGWRAWQDQQQAAGEAASELFFSLVEASNLSSTGDAAAATTANHLNKTLRTEHADSVYAIYAALLAAKQAVDGDNLAVAETQLQWAVDKAERGSSLWLIANLRLSRTILSQGGNANAERALALIEGVEAVGHRATYAEVEGDIYLALGRVDEARAAYQVALEAVRSGGIQNPLLVMKLDDLAINGDG